MSQKRELNSCPDGYRVLNTNELRELLQDDEKMDKIVRLNEKFQELQVDRETLLATNRSLAEVSLQRRPNLQNGKLLLAAKYEELAKLSTICSEKQCRLETHMQKHSPQTAQNLLQEEVARAEEQSEELLERFMEGQVPLESFLDSFQSFRKTYHIRRAQAEKIQEFSRPERKPRKPLDEVAGEKRREEGPKELRLNGISTHGPPRVIQLRYGLTPAILVPLSTTSSAVAPARQPVSSGLVPGTATGFGAKCPSLLPRAARRAESDRTVAMLGCQTSAVTAALQTQPASARTSVPITSKPLHLGDADPRPNLALCPEPRALPRASRSAPSLTL